MSPKSATAGVDNVVDLASQTAPDVSIVIPVYNEQAILHASLSDLREKLSDVDWTYEIIVAENGSTDETVRIARAFGAKHPEVRLLHVDEPNYGRALKEGIRVARGEFVICDEIDLCDTEFYARALEELKRGDVVFVVGSKRAPGSHDHRPLYRRLATQVLNGMLRVAVGFKGTDTHGLKAFRRADLLDIVEACVVDKDMFASEFVVRTHRSDKRWAEIPVDLHEKRPPSIHLLRRVPNVLRNMVRLTAIIRIGRDIR
jgi:glycosyltransferase involved in cell wall biosynthesis